MRKNFRIYYIQRWEKEEISKVIRICLSITVFQLKVLYKHGKNQ